MEKRYNYFYKITNNINGHFYYGVHCTDNLNDGYKGSGKRLHYAYKKYGVENFTKEILLYFETRKEAYEYENSVVNEITVKDSNCYNIQIGGRNGDKDLCNIIKCNLDKTHQQGNNNSQFGTCWITKDNVNKKIHKEELDTYIKDGWNIGRYVVGTCWITKDNVNKKIHKEELDTYIKDGWNIGRYVDCDSYNYTYHRGYTSIKGYVSICKGDLWKKIPKEDLNIYTNDGWYLGVPARHKIHLHSIDHQKGEKNSHFDTKWICKDDKQLCVKNDCLDLYLSTGWKLGRLKYVWIHKDSKRTRVLESKLSEYLNDGWVIGKNI